MMSESAPARLNTSLQYATHRSCGQIVTLERRAVAGQFEIHKRGGRFDGDESVPSLEMVIICRRCGVVPAAELDQDGPFCAVTV